MSRDDNEGGSATSHREFKDEENDGAARPTQHQKENEITEANSSRGIKKYRGVYFCKREGKWVPKVFLPKQKQLTLGAHLTAEMAAVARDTAFFFLKQKSDGLNFPQYASQLPRPRSHSGKDIRLAALTAARELTPKIIEWQMTQQFERSLVISAPTSAPQHQKENDHTEANSSTGLKKYRGVYFLKRQGKWVPKVFLPKQKQLTLGAHLTAEMAAVAHDTGFFFLKQKSDGLNFPQYASQLPRPRSDSWKDIRLAALTAARELTPKIFGRQMTQQLEGSVVISAPTSAPQHQKENDHTEANSSTGLKKYRGVYFLKRLGKWVPRVFLPKQKQLALGVHPTAEMAAVAHDTGFFFLKQKSDGLNFPQYASQLPRPRSDSWKDIKFAALTAARELTPKIFEGQITQQLEGSVVISAPSSAPQHQKENDHTEANSSTRLQKYRGVYFNKRHGNWVPKVFLPKRKQLALGVQPTAEMAAVAHDTGFFFLKKKSDGLNFPQYASQLPRPRSDSWKDIKFAALTAARELTPKIFEGQTTQQLEGSVVISAPTSAPTVSPTTGMRQSCSANSRDVQLLVKESRKVASKAAGPMTTRARQQSEQILGDKSAAQMAVQDLTIQGRMRQELAPNSAPKVSLTTDTRNSRSANSKDVQRPLKHRIKMAARAAGLISKRQRIKVAARAAGLISKKQRIKVAARAAGLITSKERQQPEQILGRMK